MIPIHLHTSFFALNGVVGARWSPVLLTLTTYSFSSSADHLSELTFKTGSLNPLQCLVSKYYSIWEDSRAYFRHEKIRNCSEKRAILETQKAL